MNNGKGIRTTLEDKIYGDIRAEIWKYYDDEGIEYKRKDDDENTLLDFLSYLYKLIPQTKRNVHYSAELSQKINCNEIPDKYIEVLKEYETAFSEGKDMNIFLSNNIKKPHETDFLLYTWHLFHLHMSGKFVEDKQLMKNNRSDTQLLCIITLCDVYFIDVIPHPSKAEEYFDIESLKIIVKNGWMEKIGFYEMSDMIPGTLQPKITENKDIFMLYSKGSMNVAFEFQGKGYCSLEPMSANRKPYAAGQVMLKITEVIHEMNSVDGIYKGFQFGRGRRGELLGLVKFELATKETKYYDIFTGKPKSSFPHIESKNDIQ